MVMPGKGQFEVACVGRPVNHTWEGIVGRYQAGLQNKTPMKALGDALIQFAGTPEQLSKMLRNPEADDKSKALAYALEQFAAVKDPKNPLNEIEKKGGRNIQEKLANLVDERLKGITAQDKTVGNKLKSETGIHFAMEALGKENPRDGEQAARQGIAAHQKEQEDFASRPHFRNTRSEPLPKAPTEFVPCGQGSRFGKADGGEEKVAKAAHSGPSFA